MPTMEDLLNSSDPNALKKLLGQFPNSSIDDIVPTSPANELQQSQDSLSSSFPGTETPQYLDAPLSPLESSKQILDRLQQVRQPQSVTQSPIQETPQAPSQNIQQPVPEQSKVASLMSMLGQSNPDLVRAQDSRNQQQLLANLGRAGNTIGASLTFNKADNSFYDNLDKQAGQYVQDVQNQMDARTKQLAQSSALAKLQTEQQMVDPNSEISRMYREIYKKTTGKDAPNATAAEIKELQPAIVSMFNRELAAKNAQLAREQIQAFREGNLDFKRQKDINDRSMKMGKDLDPNNSGETKKSQERLNAADRALVLVQQIPDLNLNQVQTVELATAAASLLSGGSGRIAREQIEELTPKGLKGDINKTIAWLTNKPRGLEQQKWIKGFVETINREKQLADYKIKSAQLQKAYGTHKTVKDQNPDTFYENLSTWTGYSPEQLKELESKKGFKGQLSLEDFKKLQSGGSEFEQDVLDYASQHNITPEQAQAIKMRRMGK